MHERREIPFSKHVFMFAFKWNCIEPQSKNKKSKYRSFSKKVNLITFDEKIKNLTKTKKDSQKAWLRRTYEDKHIKDYNEYSYYYHNVRDAIYTNNPSERVKDKKIIIYRYNLIKEEDPQYIIKVLFKNQDSEREKVYTLDITHIELKVYDTGVGILSFFTENYNEDSIEDVNRINEYGRRIYPQFIKNQEGVSPTQKTKETFLANQHILKLGKDQENCYVETYSSDYEIQGNRISNIIMGLFGEGFKTGKSALHKHKEDVITIATLIDDRMFVICWHVNKELSNTLKEIDTIDGKDYYSYIKNDKWYNYIFMKKEKNCQSRWMMQDILKKHTYERWIDAGTLYGMSYCSFVCLTDGNAFATENISVHMTTIYYQMMCLVLAQKASIIRFEEELTSISNHSKDISIEAVEEVYQNYLQFINGIYFREVTAEEQGIEFYILAQQLMRIDIDITELKEEMGQFFRYISLRSDKDTSKAINGLTYLNALILVPTLVTGFFGMNIFGEGLLKQWDLSDYKKLIIWLGIFIITVGIVPFAIIKSKNIQRLVKKIPEKLRNAIPWGIAFIAVLASIYLSFYS